MANIGDTVMLDGTPYEVAVYTTNAGKEVGGVWVPTQAFALESAPARSRKSRLVSFVRERDFPAGTRPVLWGWDQPHPIGRTIGQ